MDKETLISVVSETQEKSNGAVEEAHCSGLASAGGVS